MAKRLRSIPPVIPHYPPDNDRGAYAPQLWYGDEAVNAADGPWYDAPPGSIYVQGGTTTGALYSKVADTGTAGDWQALAASSGGTTGYNVRDYGATGDGATDDTAAVAAAIAALPAGGGRLRFPAGTYVCSVELPDHPKTVIIEGDGPRTTILQAKAANTPIIQGCPTVTSGIGTPKHIVRDLGLKAHASGSTGAAVQGNMSWHVFENIDLYDNGTGKFTYGFLLTDASSQHCYANTFTHIRVYNQDGPTTALFKVENTANLQFFDHIYVSNGTTATGPAVVFDLPATGYGEHYYITNSHFEGVPGDIVVPAIGTWITGCYFEDIKAGKYVINGGNGRDQYLVYLIGNKFGGTTGNQFNNGGNYVYIANRGVTISGVNGGLSMGVHNATIAKQVAETSVAEIWSNTGYAGELKLNQSGVRTWTLRNTATTGVLQFDNGDPARVTLEADGKLMANVGLGVGATAEVANLTPSGVTINDAGADLDTRIEGDADEWLWLLDASVDRVGVGENTLAAKLHVNQNGTAATIPPLRLDQADVSEDMLELNTTIGEGNAIEAAGTKVLTTTHFIKATITGVGTVYIPCGTIATP